MVLDAAKGIEPQTLKLFEVCRLRDIPIITFINKLDREAQDPMALLDEIASRLALDPAPIWWPAESGNRLRGMAELGTGRFQPYARKTAGSDEDPDHPAALPLDEAGAYFEGTEQADLADALELVEAGYKPFDRPAFLEGHMTPVLWGSALRHCCRRSATGPRPPRSCLRAGRHRPRPATRRRRKPFRSSPAARRSRASCSRSRPTWTPTTATASPCSAWRPAASSAA
jgi:peptide chain release factor 3